MSAHPHAPGSSPTLWQRGAWPLAMGISPLLIAQGRSVRRAVPKLPPAPGVTTGSTPGPRPLRVVGVGDSTVVGVGVSAMDDGLIAQFSRALAEHLGRGVSWRSVGESGATSKDILGRFIPQALAEPADVLLVSLGANDAKDLKPLGATKARFRRLLEILHEGHPDAVLIFSSLPAFYLFPTLPQPLRSLLYAHSQAIERSIRPLIEAHPFAVMSPPPPKYHDTFFAHDGFHPSVDGYRDWARFALDDAIDRGVLDLVTAG
mgnify:CR=1 FL=1